MRSSVKILVAIGILAAIVMVGVMQGWFGANAPKPLPGQPPNPVATAPSNSVAITSTPKPGGVQPGTNPVTGVKPSTQVQVSVTAANPSVITNWEERLDAILEPEGAEADKAKKLLALFSHLPEEGQVEVVQHLSNLVADQDYEALGKLLVDPTLPEDVLEQLMADILNRPNSLKLPLLVEVARNPQHPKAEDAKDLLELYLEEDYGQDWTKWQAKVVEWVQKNPD
jgi:hypothetical protein